MAATLQIRYNAPAVKGGTGYSSLSYLHRLPIDTVKIDRSFVSGIVEDSGSQAIVRAVLALASALELRVVAEGIETAAQNEMLKEMGCQLGQGFHLSPPLSAEEALELARS